MTVHEEYATTLLVLTHVAVGKAIVEMDSTVQTLTNAMMYV